ncbi:MAG: hypothetical protein MUE53_00650 [Chitinophagales bacterium]|jgi:tetratricopeptide (TPR) repeat protein|nr:hypothetical protein [Chitinophagales bacterium]
MKNYKLLEFWVRNRLWISALLIISGILWGVMDSWVFAWILVFIGVVVILAHFFIGPIVLIQKLFEIGAMDRAQSIINTVKFPNLLIKQVRSIFYFVQSNMAISNNDFSQAEAMIKESTKLGMPTADMDAMAAFQHGSIYFKQGSYKEAIPKLKSAIQKGLSDKDALAGAHMMLCNIYIQRKENKLAKLHFRNAKAAKPSNPDIKSQLKQIESYISRIPG